MMPASAVLTNDIDHMGRLIVFDLLSLVILSFIPVTLKIISLKDVAVWHFIAKNDESTSSQKLEVSGAFSS